jgi:hypothetical protein
MNQIIILRKGRRCDKVTMPECRHHAHHLDFSFDHDWKATYTAEILAYCKRYPIWYAAKHEVGENGKLHFHLVLVDEILTKLSQNDKDGASTASNKKAHLLRRCPRLKDMLANHGSRYSVCSHPCKSDYFIEYMQKEGELVYYKLPKDIAELRPYFADLLAKKPLSADFEKWVTMYRNDERPVPATFKDVWQFFGEHMYLCQYNGDIKVVTDTLKLTQRCDAMIHYVNGTVPEVPKSRQQDAKRKRED